ncbi:MAG: NADH-quinone oxidoreductase subunit A [Prevotellaceae bacterium]|jgi:NADH-quinone oxidoreductase subunit A|nr:NADH-quinone oxidoreductase subunit A [Prevotellaceae bacterium]
MNNSAMFVVAILSAMFLVGIALLLAKFLAPHSSNKLKGQAYECGIPTRGTSWMQFRVGYYLFAILYLVFDMETVLLFPWAVTLRETGINGLICLGFFVLILTLGLVYAWKKGALKWK